MRLRTLAGCLASALLCFGLPVHTASASQELLELRNTIVNLVDELVAQGIISAQKADDMKRQAALKAREQTAREALGAGEATDIAPAEAEPPTPSVVRVPYVPEFIKDEIRAEVRRELAADVTEKVVAVAREEKWGTPDALPAWMSRLTLGGDFRLRYAGVLTEDDNNRQIPDFQKINAAGGAGNAGTAAFLNTTEDINRAQIRVRLGFDAQVSDTVSAGVRLATGNDTNPISRNQTLGDYSNSFDFVLDEAWLQWNSGTGMGRHALNVRGGRIPNPFIRTSLVWDDDLRLDGISLGYGGPLFGDSRWLLNAGGFTLLREEANRADSSTNKKHWWGGQLGLDFRFGEAAGLVLAGAYYDFNDVTGELNEFQGNSRDWTAPAFITKGNTVFDIRNDLDPNTNLFALASEFELWNATARLDVALTDNIHAVWRGDYVKNHGFDAVDVGARVGAAVEERNEGWLTDMRLGWLKPDRLGRWQVFGGYRYLQRDAVMDAFTDSDFHGGGTDAKGWEAGFSIGLARNAWLKARWLSANEIDGAPAGFVANGNVPVTFAPLAIDVVQVDLNAKF